MGGECGGRHDPSAGLARDGLVALYTLLYRVKPEVLKGAAMNGDDDGLYRHHGDNEPQHGRHPSGQVSEADLRAFWRANLRLMAILLAVWALVSFGFGIFFADALNAFTLFGFPLGFWWAQQGAIYVFLVLVFVYVIGMHRLERKFGVDDDAPENL